MSTMENKSSSTELIAMSPAEFLDKQTRRATLGLRCTLRDIKWAAGAAANPRYLLRVYPRTSVGVIAGAAVIVGFRVYRAVRKKKMNHACQEVVIRIDRDNHEHSETTTVSGEESAHASRPAWVRIAGLAWSLFSATFLNQTLDMMRQAGIALVAANKRPSPPDVP